MSKKVVYNVWIFPFKAGGEVNGFVVEVRKSKGATVKIRQTFREVYRTQTRHEFSHGCCNTSQQVLRRETTRRLVGCDALRA